MAIALIAWSDQAKVEESLMTGCAQIVAIFSLRGTKFAANASARNPSKGAEAEASL